MLRRLVAAPPAPAAGPAAARGVRTGAASAPPPPSPPPPPAETLPGSSTIRVLRTVDAMRRWRRPLLAEATPLPGAARRGVGLVPTMGALHAGHLALVRAAARDSDAVVVSSYVNPAQFGAREDLASYPVSWDADAAALAGLDAELAAAAASRGGDGDGIGARRPGRVAAVFAPSTAEMYPAGFPGQDVDSKGCFVTVTPLGERLEGASRPTFFRGVATVCLKLFNAVQPERVYFGQKDVQQTVVVRRMVRELMVPTRVVVCPTLREPDGLALSSRNAYLGPRRRAVAAVLSAAVRAAEAEYRAGRLDRADIRAAAVAVCDAVERAQLALPPDRRALFDVDYVSVADPDTLDYVSVADPDTLDEVDRVDPARGAVVSAAIRMLPLEQVREGEPVGYAGGPLVRLIDNTILEPRAA